MKLISSHRKNLLISSESLAKTLHGLEKICGFQWKLPFISKTVRDRPVVAMKC